MRNAIKVTAFLAMAALPLISADVSLANSGALPAGNCAIVSGGAADFQWDGLMNSSQATAMNIDCTLPASFAAPAFPASADANVVATATVVTRDKTSSASVTCYLQVIDTYGNVNYTGGGQNSSTAETSALSWTANAVGYAYFGCVVPVATGSGLSTRSGVRGFYAT